MKTKSFNFMGKRYFVRGETDDELFDKAVKKRVELELEALSAIPAEKNLNTWFREYMDTYKQDISEYTYKSYEGLYRLNIAPVIGYLPLSAIKPALCQRVLNNVSHYSDSYIKKTYILLRSLFVKAYENDLIESVPVKGLNVPRGYKNERRALTDEERKAFLKASDNGRKSGLFCRIVFYCGLRPSEVLRIEGGDYDGRFLHVKGTKTKASTRDVPIPHALTLPELETGELMFCTVTGSPIDKKRIREYWLAVKRRMNLEPDNDLTLYCLRHDYCTRLEEAGVPLNIASRLMGHSSVELTSRIYTHGTAVTLCKAESLINQYESGVTSSQKVTKQADFSRFLPENTTNEKRSKPLKFQAFNGASWAIRTPNLLIRSGPKIRRILGVSAVSRVN